jgi:hypothetical protein
VLTNLYLSLPGLLGLTISLFRLDLLLSCGIYFV